MKPRLPKLGLLLRFKVHKLSHHEREVNAVVKAYENHPASDEFLFGISEINNRVVLRLPTDPMVMDAIYRGIRPPKEGEVRSTVTYDPQAASVRLLEIIGQPRDEPGEKPERN